MNVQATTTGSQQVAPRESLKLPEQQGDAGAFDAAVNALLSVINTSREQTYQQTFDVAGGRAAKDSAPVPDKGYSQAEELSRRVMRMINETTSGESVQRDSGVGSASGEAEEAEILGSDQGKVAVEPDGEMNNKMGQVIAETVMAEAPVGLTPPVNTGDTEPIVVVQSEEPVAQAQPQQNVHQRLDQLLGHMLMRNTQAEAAPEAQVQAVVVDEEAEVVNLKVDNQADNARLAVDLEQAAKGKQEVNPDPEPVKVVNAGNAPEMEKTITVNNNGDNQGKVAPEVVAKVVINETRPQQQPQPQTEQQPQQQPQQQQEQVPDATRGHRESLLFQNRQTEMTFTDAGKANQAPADKVDPASVLTTGNANPTGTQQTTMVNEPVTLEGLRDRMVQEIRFLYQSMGNSKQQAQVQLKLHPANLGELTVRLFFQKGGEVTAHFYAATNNVKEVLESSMQQLRTALHAHDLKLNDTQVFLSDYNRQQHENPEFNTEGRNGGNNHVASRYNANRHSGEETEAPEARPMREVDESSEYQVNYYV